MMAAELNLSGEISKGTEEIEDRWSRLEFPSPGTLSVLMDEETKEDFLYAGRSLWGGFLW
jgi:hypothetical protein